MAAYKTWTLVRSKYYSPFKELSVKLNGYTFLRQEHDLVGGTYPMCYAGE